MMKKAIDIRPGDLCLEPGTGIWREVREITKPEEDRTTIIWEPRENCPSRVTVSDSREMNTRKKR